MSKILFSTLLFIASLLAMITLMYRSENVETMESDLGKYPDFQPFLVGKTGFYPGVFNFDTNSFSFSFPVSFTYVGDYFREIDSRAIKGNWTLVNSAELNRVYVKNMDRVSLFYDIEKNVVLFIRDERHKKSINQSE